MRALERERDCVCPSNVKRERGVLCSVGCVDIRREGQKVVAKKQSRVANCLKLVEIVVWRKRML